MFRRLLPILCFFSLVHQTLPAADSDSERLERLERAVQVLQQRNAELEKEVSNLKATRKASAPAEHIAVAPATGGGKAVAEKKEVEVKPPPVTVVAGASELKLTLSGLFQTQFEGGDVFAFEGRFGSAAIDTRFRIRRARII